MSGRISTAGFYAQGVNSITSQQGKLAKLQEQLATGSKLNTGADDPVGAGQAIGLDRALAELERFDKNAATLERRLGMQENALTDAGAQLTRARDLMIQGNNSTLSDADRKSIASELTQIRESLLAIANGQDGAGRYLFGGTEDATAPFTSGAGGVTYNGDQTQRRIDIAPALAVADAAPGSEVFMRVRTGDGTMDVSVGAGNTGTGIVSDFAVTDSAAWTGDPLRVVFTTPDAEGNATRYEIQAQAADGTWATVPDSEGDYVAGRAISHGGMQVTLTGAPAVGDSVEAGTAGTRDIFATLDNAIAALATEATTPAQKAARSNAIGAALRDVAGAQDHLIDVRGTGGAALSAIDQSADTREAQGITIKTTLSGLRDLDYAQAVSDLAIQQASLEAAQAAFLQTQSMNLFQKLG
ncbi:flagellar hook-associated protein FlgL [Coralloluteibacterium stylophorae]|uniref:Flagellar hook-associated protein FlgL n=1 Tax=Coralloluteibacterium stylophorae TaxID=1776034 RepID=A0A8J8AXS3_9GAMM|nr:flagellar hook-associated protein FlgL [Coralloluteibacterium stylophorae]